ncbi:MAG: hypothetical protein FIB07_00760 [Candidatus Methanoperedens sp.]|nr:hypothetical protein [Candidatus Methanoperedens sp.]
MKNIQYNSTNHILKATLIAIIIVATTLPPANASPDMSKNVIGRALWEHYWNIQNTPEYYNGLLDRAQYINADSIVMPWGTCFFVKEIAPGQGYYDSLGRTKKTLVDFLANAHSRNITVILLSPANKMTLTGDSSCKGYFGTQYFPKDKNGTNLESTGTNYLDFNYPEARAKRIGLIKYAVSNFDFDGVLIEEPGLWLAGTTNTGYGVEWSGREGILKEHGYDINMYSYPFENSPPNANPVLLDMLHEREKGMTLFFKELRESISSLGNDYKYPYFLIAAQTYQTSYNSGCVLGNGCASYSINLTDLNKNKYIDLWLTERTSPDKIGTYTLTTQKNYLEENVRSTPDIYHSAITYITDSALNGTYLNPLFFDEISAISSLGGTSEIIYAAGFLNYNTYPPLWNRVPSVSSVSPYEWLRNNLPKTKRTFNPIGLNADSLSSGLPNITSHPANKTSAVGQAATFSVVATGASPGYQWQKNGVNIPGATGSSYNITVTDLSEDRSTFRVNLTNSFGSVVSNAATLTVVSTSSINLVRNPGFESGTTSWLFYTSGNGTFSTISPGYNGTKAANLSLISGGSNIQLYQTGITLEPNTPYWLSFTAYSTTGHDLTVNLIKHSSPYTNYGLSFTPDLGTNWQTFTTEFTTNGFSGTVNDARLMFQLGQFVAPGDRYYIDDIRLEKVENTNSIYDINNDSIVNKYDLFEVSLHFGENTAIPYPIYDVNEDGKVDLSDLILVSSNII